MPIIHRPRRIRSTRIQDSDVEMDEGGEDALTVDVEGMAEAEVEAESEDNDLEDDDEGEEEDQDEIPSDIEESNIRPLAPLPTPSTSRLKIKLKLPSHPPSRFDTPNVESEDDDIANGDSEMHSRPSMSTTRPMTTRQAVLASVLDSSHVSLTETRQKKPPLNETELALRREETARKRKNLTEKKLEDEKLETINRLLKKQSRPRTKRTTAQSRNQDDVTPTGSVSGTRSNSSLRKRGGKKAAASGGGGDDEGDAEDAMDVEVNDSEEQLAKEPQRQIPTMYRWVSSAYRKEGSPELQMKITFSVPVSALAAVTCEAGTGILGGKDADVEDVRPTRPTTCSNPGCHKPFRYRFTKDWTRGACGMVCLKALDA